jgi:hypothetical protein
MVLREQFHVVSGKDPHHTEERGDAYQPALEPRTNLFG